MSKIEWTGKTWNPIAGCSIVSTECKNCYAMRMASRLALMGQEEKYGGLTEKRNGHIVWNGTVKFDADALRVPLDTKKPTTYFVNSMSDLFHKGVKREWLLQILDVMAATPRHTYQVLTKRPERMEAALSQIPDLSRFDHVWWGTSVGYKLAVPRIDSLRACQVKTRFLSCEPLLEDLGWLNLEGIHWVIVGGESGPGARPMNLDWANSLVSQCTAKGIPVFVKQLGAKPMFNGQPVPITNRKGGDFADFPEFLKFREMPGSEVNP